MGETTHHTLFWTGVAPGRGSGPGVAPAPLDSVGRRPWGVLLVRTPGYSRIHSPEAADGVVHCVGSEISPRGPGDGAEVYADLAEQTLIRERLKGGAADGGALEESPHVHLS